MATSQFEIVLSFKPLMESLNTFVNGYQNRMQTVLAFNQKIQNGEAALRQMLGQVSAVLGGAALIKYAHDAAEADKVQQQLLRTLERTGQTGATEALNAGGANQAHSLDKTTDGHIAANGEKAGRAHFPKSGFAPGGETPIVS